MNEKERDERDNAFQQDVTEKLFHVDSKLERTNELLQMIYGQNIEATQPMTEDEDHISRVLREREERMNSTGPS